MSDEDVETKRRRYFDELYRWLANQRRRLLFSSSPDAATAAAAGCVYFASASGGDGGISSDLQAATAATALADAHLQSQLRLIKAGATIAAPSAVSPAAGAGREQRQQQQPQQQQRQQPPQQQPEQLRQPQQARRANPAAVYGGRLGIEGYRFRVAPIWKRVCAELIDGLLLLVVKIVLMIALEQRMDFVVDSLLPVDNRLWRATGGESAAQEQQHNRYRSEFGRRFGGVGGGLDNEQPAYQHHQQQQQQHLPELDIAGIRFSMTDLLSPRLILMDLMVRVLVLLLESLSLCGCFGLFRAGQTPGKWLLNLQVVQANDVIDLPDQIIEVLPANPLGFQRALARSAIKNLAMMFFFPVWATAFVFSNHRTSYDIITSTIVVENLPPEAD